VIFFTTSGLVSINPANGKWLWFAPVKFSVATAASPVVWQEIVYCSSGYGVGASAFRISKNGDAFAATLLWKKPGQLINLWSTPVAYNGHLYGLYGFKEFNTMPLKCIDIQTGSEIWSHEGFGQGGLILAGDKLLVQGDQGQLVLVQADETRYHELARAHPIAGKSWQMPVAAEGKIFARSDKQAVCLEAK
jgi:outer membrane protein assembly factor BamB